MNSDGWFVLGADESPIQIDDMTAVQSFSFDTKGTLTVVTADGEDTLGPIGLTKFANPDGLQKVGGSLFRMTPNANPDDPEIGEPGDPDLGLGQLMVGALEMSNVDLTNEFAEMIVAQRGFQANSRTITTSDEILQEVITVSDTVLEDIVNLKR